MAEKFSFYTKPQTGVSVAGSVSQPAAASTIPSWINTTGQSVMPRSSSGVPPAASNNDTIKQYTNGGINWGQVSALASGALGMMSGYTNYRYNARALDAQATAYLNQMPLNYAAYRTNVNYLAEENFANVSRIISESESFAGSQMAGIAASGFDMSSGENRIIRDTYQKMANEVYLANRSAYLQSFELWRSTEIENARLKAAADSARSQAKYMRKMGKVNLIAGAIGTMAEVYSLGQPGKTGDVDVRGVKKA